jgi:spore germination protein
MAAMRGTSLRGRASSRRSGRYRAGVAVAAALGLGASMITAASAAPVPRASDGLRVTGYAEQGTPAEIVDREAHALTTVGVDGVSLRPSGGAVGPPDKQVLTLLQAAHHNRLRAELLVSNFDDRIGDFSPAIGKRLLQNPGHVTAVAAQLAGWVSGQGWDGITVDLESLVAADGPGLTDFVQALQADMPADRTVSVDLMASPTVSGYTARGYRLTDLTGAADVLALMAYDDHGPTWSGPGPIGPLPWVHRTLDALLQVVPPGQVDLGVAGYGYTWPAPPHRHDGRQLTDAGARRLVHQDGARAVWKPGVGEWTATLSDGTVVWWSDARSWLDRVAIAQQDGLHGLALWRLGSADPLP